MTSRYLFPFCVALVCAVLSRAQHQKPALPEELTIATHAFIDVGPPNDSYELVRVRSIPEGLKAERVRLVPGATCVFYPEVEQQTAVVQRSMAELLAGGNPCAIPEKELHREQKRCKHCLVFSGVQVTMQARCGGQNRILRMDILDRDIFDTHPGTPGHTSWTMQLLERIEGTPGISSWKQPMFGLTNPPPAPIEETPLIQEIERGDCDALFGPEEKVGAIIADARKPKHAPLVEILSSFPVKLEDQVLPVYPPIAKATRVEGTVKAAFEISGDGSVRNVRILDGPKMLEQAALEAIGRWKFPVSSSASSGQASIRFQMNCKAVSP